MGNVDDQRWQALAQQIWATVREQAPASKEASQHARKLHAWAEEAKTVAQRAVKLANSGKAVEAQDLLDSHNALRPRRRPGRPANRLPTKTRFYTLLNSTLIEAALAQLSKDPRKKQQLVSAVSTTLLRDCA